MDYLTFTVELINTLIWPACSLIIVFTLKDKILDLFPRLEKFKYKDLELELSKVPELESSKAPEESMVKKDKNLTELEMIGKLLRAELCILNPAGYVESEYDNLCNKASELLTSNNIQASEKSNLNSLIESLVSNKIIECTAVNMASVFTSIYNKTEAFNGEDLAVSLVSRIYNLGNLLDFLLDEARNKSNKLKNKN